MSTLRWYWIRRNSAGTITAAIIEGAFSAPILIQELAKMAELGPIERIQSDRGIVVGVGGTE